MAYVVFCFWLFGFFLLWHIPRLKAASRAQTADAGVSVIIPARNEEGNIGNLLHSLSRQQNASMEVIVVDDQSEDATAEIATQYGVRILASGNPPQGWLGKPWACWQGAQAASKDLLLFVDADVVLAPGALSRLVANFLEGEGLLSLQPYHQMQKNYERLSAIFNIVVMAGVNAFTPFTSRFKPAGAFGPLMLCRKRVYLEVGGHKTAKDAVLESLPMGKAFIRAGHPVRCFGGRGSVTFRMYPHGLRSMVEGFGKGFSTGANAISVGMMIMLVCWIFGGVSLTRHLIEAMIAGQGNAVIEWLALDVLYAAQVYWMLFRIGNFGLRTAVFFQIPLLFFVLIFSLSLIKTALIGRSRWKGRVIKPKTKGSRPPCD